MHLGARERERKHIIITAHRQTPTDGNNRRRYRRYGATALLTYHLSARYGSSDIASSVFEILPLHLLIRNTYWWYYCLRL